MAPRERAASAPSPIRDDPSRLAAFAAAIDALRDRVEPTVGADDLARVRRVDRVSRVFEVVGRSLIHVALDPLTLLVGVLALFVHKQLQTTEVGHTTLHGAYDRVAGADAYRSATFRWDTPIDEASWRTGHNLRHHGFTNIAHRDPDLRFGRTRLTEHLPGDPGHERPGLSTVINWATFTAGMNLHFTGMLDLILDRRDVLRDRTWPSARVALWRAFRSYAPYYAKSYLIFPLLAGPLWWKVVLANSMAELLRNAYTAACIFCGHVGPGIVSYPEGTKARGRPEWYVMQCEATQNFEVPYALSVLCGGLDYQIEHHLFPRLPPERLRAIAGEVRQICEEHGVPYRSGTWPTVLSGAMNEVFRIARGAPRA